MRTLMLILAVSTLVAPMCDAAQETASDLLMGMSQASRQLNYEGVFVYRRDGQSDTIRLEHIFKAEKEKERLVSMSGPERELIRDDGLVAFRDGALAEGKFAPAPQAFKGEFTAATLSTLSQNYDFTLGDIERVAGRVARFLSMTPKYADRYAHRLWLDVETRLPLKSEIASVDGDILEQVEFAQLNILEEVEEDMIATLTSTVSVRNENAGSMLEIDNQISDPAWNVAWLPPGFEMAEQKSTRIAGGRGHLTSFMYSDGLAMVSVYVKSSLEQADTEPSYAVRGAVNVYSRAIDENEVTVVGDLPMATVQRISAAIRQVPGQD